MEEHLLLSEYGGAAVEYLRERRPVREYRAHVAILRGKAKKQQEEQQKAEREANNAG